MTKLSVAVAASCSLIVGCAEPFIGPDDIVVASPEEFVSVARQLIAEGRADPSKPAVIPDERLPPSLRIQRFGRARWPLAAVRDAVLHADHLDLVLVRHTDGDAGARVWARTHRPHRDKPTRYTDIYFYVYSVEEPESPDNVP